MMHRIIQRPVPEQHKPQPFRRMHREVIVVGRIKTEYFIVIDRAVFVVGGAGDARGYIGMLHQELRALHNCFSSILGGALQV